MIKLKKNIHEIPSSLIPAYIDLFPDNKIPLPTRTTHEKRIVVIDNENYIDASEFNNRYKYEDVRKALKTIYKHKCAYCEQRIEQYNVEHYRPKKIYYWLAFSWDNLLMACTNCNINKGMNFELEDGCVQVSFSNTETNLRNINISSAAYDAIEKPKMVNPEITDPSDKIRFKKNGLIESDDYRFAYTIDKCKINRVYLNDERRVLLSIFERDIRSALIDNTDVSNQKQEIAAIVRKFIRDAEDKELPFLAFRRYAISEDWLNDLIKNVIHN